MKNRPSFSNACVRGLLRLLILSWCLFASSAFAVPVLYNLEIVFNDTSANYGYVTVKGFFTVESANRQVTAINGTITYQNPPPGVPATNPIALYNDGGYYGDQILYATVGGYLPISPPHVTTMGIAFQDTTNGFIYSWICDQAAQGAQGPAYEVLEGVGTTGNIGNFPVAAPFVSFKLFPIVTGLSVTSGPAGGGTSVQISGYQLSSYISGVKFGSVNASSYSVNSDTSITAVSPANLAGPVDVTILNRYGASATSSADLFTYIAAPSITSLSQSAGPTSGSTSVIITGTGFNNVTGVKFGSTNATNYAVNSTTQITAVAPAGTVGTVDVSVISSTGGTSQSVTADKFTYVAAPFVTGLSVNSGSTAGGNTVVISGTNFTGATAVKFGNTSATSFTVNSSTQITATSPAGAAGTNDVTVVTVGGTSTTSANDQYTYIPQPAVTSVSPNAAPISGATPVTITGSNFTGVTSVMFGASNATSFTVNSATQITATAPSGVSGTVDITVANNGVVSSVVIGDQFSYVAAPVVASLVANAGPTTGGNSVTITGSNFNGATGVKFGNINATSYTVNSNSQINATVPSGGAGTVDVTVTTVGGTSVNNASDSYTYVAAPTVSSLSVSSGTTAGSTSVIITGTNFTGATAVKFGTANATSFTINSSTQITATAPAASAGTVDITVTTAGGSNASSPADQYTYIALPGVSSLSVSAGPLAGGTSLQITGSNFTGATVVKFGAASASIMTVNSATQITVTAPAGLAGTVDVTVTTPVGTSSIVAADQFTYMPVPVVSGIATAAGPTAGGNAVVINGSGFTGASVVKFGGSNASAFTVNSATQITATAPAGSAGIVDVVVTTAGGTSATLVADHYNYVAAPTVSALSVSSGTSAGGTSVVITGTYLTGATAVKFGNTNAASYVVNSATQITATAPAGSAGAVDVTVTTAGGVSTTSAADQYTFVPTGTLSFTQAGPLSLTMGGSLTNAASSTLSGGSYGAISYSSSNTAIATINASGVVTPVAIGSVTITATQAAVSGINLQATATYTLNVVAVPVPVLSFSQSGPQSVNLQATLNNVASSNLSGGNYGAISYSSSNTAVATVSSSGVLTPVALGNVTITATQAAAAGFNAQVSASYAVTVTTVPVPVLSFAHSGGQSVNLAGSLNNAASSSLSGGNYGAISYSSSNTSIVTVSGTGVITPAALGTATITATQAAATGFNTQATASYTLTVNPVPTPVLSFSQAGPVSVALAGSVTNLANSTLSGGSYGAISYISTNPAVATVNASGMVTPVSLGTTTITATQSAVTGINNQATNSYTINVIAVPVPVLIFQRSGSLQISSDVSLNNPVTSNLSGNTYGVITYGSSNTAIALVDRYTGTVTPVAAGSVTITATQAAVNNVNAQGSATYNLIITAVPAPVLNFTLSGNQQVMAGNSLSNSASSSLSGGSYGLITYSSSNPAIATVNSSGLVSAVSAGTVTVTATQAAVQGINTIGSISYTLTVNALPLGVLNFALAGNQSMLIGGSLNNPAGSSLSGSGYGAISYSSSNPAVASVNAAGVVSAISIGSVTITATQAAVNGKNGVASQSYTVTVGKNNQATLTLTADKTSIYKNTGQAVLSVSGGSGSGAVSYALSSGNCSLSGNVVTAGNVAGTCVVIATKAADSSYSMATASINVQVLNQVAASLNLNLSSNQLMQGQKLTLTATLTPGTATGTVNFYDGSSLIGSAALNNGVAVLVYAIPTIGSHNFTASFAGDSNVSPANSNNQTAAAIQRPDPTLSGSEPARISAQVRSSQQFNLAQISNINNHLGQLHSRFGVNNDFGVGMRVPYLDTIRLVGGKMLDNLVLANNSDSAGNTENGGTNANGSNRMARANRNTTPYSKGEASHDGSMSADGQSDGSHQEQDTSRSPYSLAGMPVGFWSTGNIDVGGMDGSDGNRTKFSTNGISFGMDVLIRKDVIVGGALGFGKDDTTLDGQGSESRSHQWSGSMYASYRADRDWFIDSVLGFGRLHSENTRWDASSAALLTGSRGGSSVYGSVALTRAMKWDSLRMHPFGRLDVIHARLDAYSENPDSMALSYNQASYTNTAFVGGLDLLKDYSFESGRLTPSLKFQLRHNLSGSLTQSLYYSELGSSGGLYNIVVQGLPDNMATLGLGLGFTTRNGISTNLSWTGSMGSNTYRSNGLRMDVQMGFR